ncbi:MAG: hypothetical protein GTO24_01415, partial [candidate division Zixibacteria bacterium]|nr:hypothetical protein [candidate division Zixibacteria bacterium]
MTKLRLMTAVFTAVCVLILGEEVFPQENYQVRYTAEFSMDDFSFDRVMGYDMVWLKEGGHLAEPGKPMLPSREIRISLPSGMQVTGLQVVNTTWEEIPGEFGILPSQPPRRIGLWDDNIDFVQPDPRIYSSTQPYPADVVEYLHQTDLAGQGMAVVRLYPLQYVPPQKRLTLYTSISFAIL